METLTTQCPYSKIPIQCGCPIGVCKLMYSPIEDRPPAEKKEQTAVQWLESMVNRMIQNGGDLGEDLPALMNHIQKAKAMERENIIEAFDKGKWDSLAFKGTPKEEYYNETYGLH
jgi:hypothetical protein